MSRPAVHLVRASDLAGRPVVTIDGGEDAAEIKDVVYDASRHHLIGFTLNKRGWYRGALRSVLATDSIAGMGADAVMITSEAALASPADAPEALADRGPAHDVIGNDVVSSDGSVLGQVTDVIIETGHSPRAAGYEVATADGTVFVPSSAQMSVSGANLIVPAEAEEFINNDLVGFGASVATFRERLAMSGDES